MATTEQEKSNILNVLTSIYSENGYCTYDDLECSCPISESQLKSTIQLMKKKGIITLVNDDGETYYQLNDKLMDNIFCALGVL